MSMIQKGFETFRDTVYPDGTMPNQHEQIRMAFFAGSLHAMNLTEEIARLDEEEGTAMLQAMESEFAQFIKERIRHRESRGDTQTG